MTASAARPFDLTLVSNTAKAKRVYDGLTADLRYRLSSLQVGGNYTLARTWGNFNGENVSSGPVTADTLTYPEYRQASWNYPTGDLQIDQRFVDTGQIDTNTHRCLAAEGINRRSPGVGHGPPKLNTAHGYLAHCASQPT